jgi:transposase
LEKILLLIPLVLGEDYPQARKGQALSSRSARVPVGEMEAEVSRLRQEVARLKVEKEILKKAAAYFAKESM